MHVSPKRDKFIIRIAGKKSQWRHRNDNNNWTDCGMRYNQKEFGSTTIWCLEAFNLSRGIILYYYSKFK